MARTKTLKMDTDHGPARFLSTIVSTKPSSHPKRRSTVPTNAPGLLIIFSHSYRLASRSRYRNKLEKQFSVRCQRNIECKALATSMSACSQQCLIMGMVRLRLCTEMQATAVKNLATQRRAIYGRRTSIVRNCGHYSPAHLWLCL